MSLKLKFRTQFPAVVTAASPLTLVKTGLLYAFGFDIAALRASLDPLYVPVQTQQIKTTAGDVTVVNSDGVIVLNKAVGAATNVTFPLAAGKSGDCLVTDLKGDAGTNNITLTPTSPETIMGLATYTIAANGASLRLKPVPGIGYVI